ncbi:LacI family DNA-binding transcriptional regulator [Acetatifactor muris]|uniref:HTH-type transcriptional regulator GalR n=1 Tax=Acetatifactor muris TaxID=879566 RepID=A0A2K4ZLW5_9FIRM|nr:LacI family DNA-binding transcriptional regulator [Acetatifactor muris]MCR2049670.1 LacI family DNA-binding transcriptional regulator [Acetatifactor muris]SOY31435.1 HTH-type transcriptional regulator GalR [Acetatifactor muris]
MSVTAKELASLLNLSEAAVSMALNGKPGVSTATRKKVMETAEKHGYDFSRITAKAPAPRPSQGTLYFIIYRKHGAVVTDTPFFSQLSQGIDSGCKKYRYFLNVFYLDEGDNPERQLRELIHFDCRGILLLGTEMLENDVLPFLKLNLPLVILDTYFETIEADYILINNAQGAYLATCHLLSRCREQPGYLRSSYPINNFTERADGFYRAVRRNGMSTPNSKVHYLSPSAEGAYADMTAILNAGEKPARCYFADNDLIACGAMKALKEKGYRIPQDVSIVGFDNMPMAAYTEPALTTVNVPKEYMGEMAVCRLSQLIESPGNIPVKLEISTTLVKRKTV